MNCPCDELVFPRPLSIGSGLTDLPRQLATFPEWRQALLASLGGRAALAGWRPPHRDDLGVMLLEMWAYVCDVISFYDQVIAHEGYVRTARQRSSTRRLVELLGYLPRPAVAAIVKLAAFAEGKQALTLPAGTAFRSSAFAGNPPQVFELDAPATVHALLDRWTFEMLRPTTLGDPYSVITTPFLLMQPGSVRAKAGDRLLILEAGGRWISKAASVAPFTGDDGAAYIKVDLDAPVYPIGYTTYAEFRALTPTAAGSLWKLGKIGGDPDVISGFDVVLDGLNRQIRAGDYVLLSRGEDVRWFKVTKATETMRRLLAGLTSQLKDKNGAAAGSVTSPDVTVAVTTLSLDAQVNWRKGGWPDWTAADAPDLTLHYGLIDAGRITTQAKTTLTKNDSLQIRRPHPDPGVPPTAFLLEDDKAVGVTATGTLNFVTGAFAVDPTVDWTTPLAAPVQLYGNVLTATRGETVAGEVLGVGDAAQARQSFTLKKKPLTYLPSPTAGNESGVASTLRVYVGGVQWQEVPSFFGTAADAQVYVVRQNDAGESTVTFGGGARLPSGAVVTATYRFGAGAAAPPAGAVHQLARPVRGLKSVRNPLAAFGGADAESAEALGVYAPRSALLLGRAVSIQDLEAAAATVGGVRAVAAEWRWNEQRQRPLVQIYFVGAPALAATISQKLRGLTDPTTPIAVTPATALSVSLAIQVDTDPRRLEADVLKAVRAALLAPAAGALTPERLGIGRTLFRSELFAAVLAVPGATAVRQLLLGGTAFPEPGINPGAGTYLDFAAGGLLLNGMSA